MQESKLALGRGSVVLTACTERHTGGEGKDGRRGRRAYKGFLLPVKMSPKYFDAVSTLDLYLIRSPLK